MFEKCTSVCVKTLVVNCNTGQSSSTINNKRIEGKGRARASNGAINILVVVRPLLCSCKRLKIIIISSAAVFLFVRAGCSFNLSPLVFVVIIRRLPYKVVSVCTLPMFMGYNVFSCAVAVSALYCAHLCLCPLAGKLAWKQRRRAAQAKGLFVRTKFAALQLNHSSDCTVCNALLLSGCSRKRRI